MIGDKYGMRADEQANVELYVRDRLDELVREDAAQDGLVAENPDWDLKVEESNRAPTACHTNQTVLEHKNGSRYLITVCLIEPPRNHKRKSNAKKNENRTVKNNP